MCDFDEYGTYELEDDFYLMNQREADDYRNEGDDEEGEYEDEEFDLEPDEDSDLDVDPEEFDE